MRPSKSRPRFTMPLLFGLLLALALLGSCQAPGPADGEAGVLTAGGVVKSAGDARDYAYFELPNRLRVLVISDPGAEKAAVSLNVATGSMDDPDGRDGLAHFLEHMLFLGTGKYPEAGDYQAFIADHGGQHNAYTAFDHTNYFFDINAAELEPALDRFSRFFIDPLFTARYVEREKHAVESEYRTKYKDEARRGLDAFRQIVNPEHPFAQFSVGNLETLADREGSTVRDELLAFYDSHYSANVMDLVVLGRAGTGELKAQVEKFFAAVPDRDLSPTVIADPLLPEGGLPLQLFVTPEKNLRRLDMSFEVPDPYRHWRAKPLHLIADVLGHEGEGSLLQYLKAQGWAESLSAGEGLSYREGAILSISVALTERGYAERDQVVAAVFQAINRIAEAGIGRGRFAEQERIGQLRFRYQEKVENIHYVRGLASAMAQYPPEWILQGSYIFSDYEPGLYREYLAHLVPDNLLLITTGPELPVDQVSPLYETPYAVAPPSATQLELWRGAGLNPAITMPAPNPFIPEQLARLPAVYPDARPVPLLEEERLEIWQGDDQRFRAPRASLRLVLDSPAADDTARHRVLGEFLAAMISDGLNAKLYPALLVGFNASVTADRRGLQVAIDGFSDKQAELLAMIVAEIKEAQFDAARFADIKQTGIRNWENARRAAPYRYLPATLRKALLEPFWDDRDKLQAVRELEIADLEAYRQSLLDMASARLLCYGNVSPERARAYRDVLLPLLGEGPAPALPGVGVVELAAGERWRQAVELPHSDAAIAYYIQGASDSNHQRVLMALTGQIVRTPFYHSLRTEQQLGYVVYAAPTVLERVPGLTFMVQSPVADAGSLVEASNTLLRDFNARAQTLSEAAFAKHKLALASQINRPHQGLVQEAAFMWDQLLQGYPGFDRREQLTAALEALTLPEWQAYYASTFTPAPGATVGRSLVVYHRGERPLAGGDALSSAQRLTSPGGFRAGHSLRRFP